MTNTTRCSFTGHRPSGLPFGYNEQDRRCKDLKMIMFAEVCQQVTRGVVVFNSGMALGVDTYAAKVVLYTRSIYPHIRLIAVLPCREQDKMWRTESKAEYHKILSQCDSVQFVSEAYSPTCMHLRDDVLVQQTDVMIAIYNGSGHGGTAYTVEQALKQGKKVVCINPIDFSLRNLH